MDRLGRDQIQGGLVSLTGALALVADLFPLPALRHLLKPTFTATPTPAEV